MATTMASSPTEVTKGLPRNSSIDSAISAISFKQSSLSKGAPQEPQSPQDIARLIHTAGSPETLVQHLLKEKHSQSQQNSQLWRLVDKQRAMILGLNKDLESALREKEKYRRKLKEIIASPAALKISNIQPGQPGQASSDTESGPASPCANVPEMRAGIDRTPESPDSPGRRSDTSQKDSPIDIDMAPYPITPPADRSGDSPTVVVEALHPRRAMPKPREHAVEELDSEVAEKTDKTTEKDWKEKHDQQHREVPLSASLPPSRSLPSEPPKIPPPKVPTIAPPYLMVVEPSPRPDQELSQFPSPPRKAPPTALQLGQQNRAEVAQPADEDDSDSDYDDILEVAEILDDCDTRGRRKTREDDEKERDVAISRPTNERSVSDMGHSRPASTLDSTAGQPLQPKKSQQGRSPALNALLLAEKPLEGKTSPSLLSPGLPVSPRPMGNIQHSASAPLPGRSPATPALSPRPPRQPILLPQNTVLGASPALTSTTSSPMLLSNRGKPGGEADGQSSPPERTKIFNGLVTEDYPDLLLPPNALPSIKIKVASSRMKPSRASLLSLTQLEEDPVFTLAIISRADQGELWRVEKDIASLGKLDQRLKQCAAFTAKTPERSLFSGHAPAKLDARRLALEHYMDELLDTPLDTPTAVELCKYLSTHTLAPNTDETGSSVHATPENSGLRVSADGRPLRSGYLTKKGKNFGGWKARFFVLEGALLKYYETPGGAHLGTIKLQNAQIGKQSQGSDGQSLGKTGNGEDLDNQYRHAFLILEPKKKDSTAHVKHILCAENDRERDAWVDGLLQWIDSRDPNDAESQGSRPGQNFSSEPHGGGKSKKGPGKPHQPHAESDALIGVRYDSTHAGDAPHRGTANAADHSSSHNLPVDTTGSHALKIISAPKDPHIISDSSSWGNKVSLSIPTHDEKKQRKRSFFGLGPKARSSSDGQDSLFGGSDAGSLNAANSAHGHPGPVRQVFGAPLAEAVRYNPPLDVNVPLPSVVYRCIQYLDDQNAVIEEGIFRLSGSNVVIKQLRERFNVEGDINLVTDEQYYDIHAVASLLKLYLRELPTTILTRDLHLEFLATTELQDRSEKVAKLNELAQRLPQVNATLLKYLIAFLIRIINNSDVNKMNVRNVGIVFSPTLNIPAQVFAMFLQNYEGIFGLDPEEYELPSPTTESDPQGHIEGPPQRFEPPRRPSTSSGTSSASPHRQPRKDLAWEHSRSTPTPPLTFHSGPSRPAYETHYSAPTSPDPHGYSYHQRLRASPAYDRTAYQLSGDEQGAPLQSPDHQQTSHAKRRESSIYMGGVVGLPNGQGSKSRLREESRF